MSDPLAKIREGIAFFEQVLQSMPTDRSSLEFLAIAYEQTGQTAMQRDVLVRLAEVLLTEKEFDSAQSIAERLSEFSDYPPAKAIVSRIADETQAQILRSHFRRELEELGSTESTTSGMAGLAGDGSLALHALSSTASAAEMSLVWHWKDRGYLADDLCMELLDELTDRPVTDTPHSISAMLALDARYPELSDAVMEAMQKESGLPLIPLNLLDPTSETMAILPPLFSRIKAVVVFGLIGEEALVALLNPLNAELRNEIRGIAKRVCHFFIAHPRDARQLLMLES